MTAWYTEEITIDFCSSSLATLPPGVALQLLLLMPNRLDPCVTRSRNRLQLLLMWMQPYGCHIWIV